MKIFDSLINLTFNTHYASIVRDFSGLSTIGKNMYITEQGGVTMEYLDRLNGKKCFKKMLVDNPNPSVTPYGIIYKNKKEFEQVYDDIHFPTYYWEENMVTESFFAYSRPPFFLATQDITEEKK